MARAHPLPIIHRIPLPSSNKDAFEAEADASAEKVFGHEDFVNDDVAKCCAM
jgi:hypothetical protein